MKSIIVLLFSLLPAGLAAQIMDLDLDFPVLYSPSAVLQAEIHSLSFVESGDNGKVNIKKEIKSHRSGQTTYFFDSTGVPFMKEIGYSNGFTDTFMMNRMRCESKNDPDSRFYEPNVFCNEKGMVVANQTDKSSYFYRYEHGDQIMQWVRIDRDEDAESSVFTTIYEYNDTGMPELIVEKTGELRFNLGTRLVDTIFKTSVVKRLMYTDGRPYAMVTYTKNNLDQIIASSTYKYHYKEDLLYQVDLFVGDEKQPVYTFKLLKKE